MTLIEKLTVASLIGILGAIAVPTWTGFVAAQELKTDADQIQSFLQMTRSEATKKKSQWESALKNCQTDSSCSDAQVRLENQSKCNELIALLIEQPLARSLYTSQQNFVIWEDGSCTLPTTFLGNLTPLGRSASAAQTPTKKDASLILPLLVVPELKSAKTATSGTECKDKGCDRRHKAATKKPKKNSLTVEGCFRTNGQFVILKDKQYHQVDWSSIPANTTIKTTAPLCPAVGVN